MLSLLFLSAFDLSASTIDDGRFGDFLQRLPSAYTLEYLLEGNATGVVQGREDSLGITRVDPQKVSIRGDSYAWTQWWWNGIDISDPLFAGAQAFRLPFRLMDQLSIKSGGIAIDTEVHDGTSFGGLGVTDPFGGRGPLSVEIADKYSGTHPSQRDPLPPNERRQFAGHGVASLVDRKGDWRYGVEVTQGQRRFLNFPGSYFEPYLMASAAAQYSPGWYHVLIAAEARHRGNLFAEDHHSQQETAPFTSGSLFAGVIAGDFKVGSTVKLYDIGTRDVGFTREQHDVDGESLQPYTPRGRWFGGNIDLSWARSVMYAQWNQKWLTFVPAMSAWSNPQLFDGVPIGRIDWTSRATALTYASQKFGVTDDFRLGLLRVTYDAYLFGTFSNKMANLDVGLRAELKLELGHGLTPYLVISRTPVPITSQVARLTTPGLLSGKTYANDTLIDTNDIAIGRDLLATKIHMLSLGLRWQFAEHWYFLAQGIAKTFDDGYWLQFRDGVDSAMEYVGDRYYYRPGPKSYVLQNAPWSQTPFYLAAQGQLVGSDRDRYLFSLGLATFVSMGATAFGNGPAANDLGVIDTTMANPNGRFFPQGNLDGDRAYVFKMSTGYRFVSTFWGFFTARFRDGQPFAFLDWKVRNGQASATYVTNKGSLYALTGPRTDAIIVFDLLLSYTIPLPHASLRLDVTLANFWDPQTELSERHPNGDSPGRASLELQLPRMAMFNGELQF